MSQQSYQNGTSSREAPKVGVKNSTDLKEQLVSNLIKKSQQAIVNQAHFNE